MAQNIAVFAGLVHVAGVRDLTGIISHSKVPDMSMSTKRPTRLVIELPQGLKAELLKLAGANDRTLSAEVRKALLAHLAKDTEESQAA